MTSFKLPKSAERYKKIPKNKLIPKTKQGVDGNKLFYDISAIAIVYWLSESTIHIPKTDNVKELIILDIILKTKNIPKDAVKIIQESFGSHSPILFSFRYEENFCYGISLLDEKKYYFSDWNEVKEFQFNDTNLERIYQGLVKQFLTNIDADTTKNVDFKHTIELDSKAADLTKRIETLKGKISREKQFNKKTELNRELKQLKKELKQYKGY